ncbi:S-layer homology domain-containing protein [Petroclostridium sp. X23]|uniref:S-layer homology domain-containing protein n=1 Tax=Petroclostridium sp. X23 TaxID=3045146 RepID=UPI0024ACBF7E|nr:S-layer homology domain-containing protein [Petroclostridium sp. X23]WHH57396.1 S-layer homology domain-containing protein [Petroclostridium sp. X23]
MKRKLWLVFTVSILLTTFSATVFAASFPDVEDAKWSWAKSIVEEMSSKGYISGYPDGTFGPSLPVTKLQSLILMARILGVNDDENKNYVELAQKNYSDDLQLYSISNKKEVSYLLYKNIITVNELDTYISPENENLALKRYEAAVLFTKAMGKEKEVKSKLITILPYSDVTAIPSSAKPYVEFVKDEGIMQGMTETQFGPMEDVNRAQMAVMLYRVLTKNEEIGETSTGKVTSKDIANNTLKIKDIIDVERTYEINNTTIIKVDGETANLADIQIGTEVLLTWKSEQLYMVEGVSAQEKEDETQVQETVEGIITGISAGGNIRSISLSIQENGQTIGRSYSLDKDVSVLYNDVISSLNNITVQDYATLVIKNNIVTRIEVQSKNVEVHGTVQNIMLGSVDKLEIKLDNGTLKEFEVLDDAEVIKNNSSLNITGIVVGDPVYLMLEYNKIKKVTVSAVSSITSGNIEEIIISNTPSIKIKNGNDEAKYYITGDTIIKIDDVVKEIYDLRLGYPVELVVNGNAVNEIKVKSEAQVTTLSGTVTLINSSYNLLNISVTDTDTGKITTQQIFIGNDTKIIRNSDSKALSLSDIKIGDAIAAVRTKKAGVFEASTIVVVTE